LTELHFSYNDLDEKSSKQVQTFLRTAISYDAAPKVHIQYRRYAWVSEVDEYARVTFDKDIRCKSTAGYDFNTIDMLNYDGAPVVSPEGDVVLELKCYSSQVPLWMLDLIQTFQLHRISFSKYMTSMMHLSGTFNIGYETRSSGINFK
jgi:hypothetical protein